MRARLVERIDGTVGTSAVGHEQVGELDRREQRVLGDRHVVMALEALEIGSAVAPSRAFGAYSGQLFELRRRQNRLHVYRMKDGTLEPAPAYALDTLAEPQNVRPAQRAGTLHVHPNGRYLYVANRASGTTESDGRTVFAGGENNIAVYSLSERAGKPALIQHVDSGGFVPRTFAIDPSQSVLVTASIKPLPLRQGSEIVSVPAAISVFRIQADGTLAFERNYDIETNGGIQYWMGIVGPQSETA